MDHTEPNAVMREFRCNQSIKTGVTKPVSRQQSTYCQKIKEIIRMLTC